MIVVIDAKAAAHDPVFGDFPVKLHFNDDIEFHVFFFQGLMKFYRLVLIPGKSVQEPAVFAVIFFQPVKNHRDGDIIGDQIPFVDVGLGLFAQFGAAFDIFSENGAGFNMGDVVFFL